MAKRSVRAGRFNPEKSETSDKIDAAKLFVAAIDFGTTFSGYAFSTRSEPKTIYTCEWKKNNLQSMKAPTAVLLDSKENFVAFGYDAETKYMTSLANDADDDEDSDDDEDKIPDLFYYFSRFKMMLHKEMIDMDSEITDKEGKHTMKAFDVFRMAIGYLKNETVKKLQRTLKGVDLKDIHYVLTVPAIWHDQSKMFMRKAAEKAGIQGNQLTIALEPEAASIYCQELRTEREDQESIEFKETIKKGTKYIVVDLGGGTADITVHERQLNGSLEEVVPPSGGDWGGTAVDKAYVNFLKTIFTPKVIEQFEREELEDYTELIHQFEVKKRSIKSTTHEDIVLNMPIGLIDMVKKLCGGVEKVIIKSGFKDSVSFTSPQRITIKPEVFRNLFKPTIDALIKHLVELFKNPSLKDLKHMVMVGGFSECELVQTALREKFSNKMKIIVPDEAGLAVLKGAVLFGHQPEIVKKRILKKTYGIQSWPEFDSSIHPETKRVSMDGTDRCRDVFFRFATKGEKVEAGHSYSQIFQVLKPDERTLECGIYVSDDVNPRYITDPSCQRLGLLTIPLPQIRDGEQLEIEETMIFGGTELLFRARNLKNNAIYETQFQF